MHPQKSDSPLRFFPDNARYFGALTGALAAMALLWIALAFGKSGVMWNVLFGAGAIACATGAWLAAEKAFDKQALLTVYPGKGLKSPQWAHGVAWGLLQDVQPVRRMYGRTTALALHLRPGMPWPGRQTWWSVVPKDNADQGRTLILDMAACKPATQQAVCTAVMQDFQRFRSRNGWDPESARTLQEGRVSTGRLQTPENGTSLPWVVYATIALNVLVWLVMGVYGISPFMPSADDLFAWGANSAVAVVRQHAYWRLAVSTVLHAGILHLLVNMLGLWQAGVLLARYYRRPQWLLIYWGSALTGSGVSLHFAAQKSVSVGASGAVFGVLGALLVVWWRHRDSLEKWLGKNQIASIAIFIVYALRQGFERQVVDNSAHVAGLLAGMVMAALLSDALQHDAVSLVDRRIRTMLAATLALLLTVALVLTTSLEGAEQFDFVIALPRAMQPAMQQVEQAEESARGDWNRLQQKKLSSAQLAENISQIYLPAMQAAIRQFKEAPRTGNAQKDATLDFMVKSIDIRSRKLQILGEMAKAPAYKLREYERKMDDLEMERRRLEAQAPRCNAHGQAEMRKNC